MRKASILLLLGAFLIFGFGRLSSQQSPEDAKFAKTLEQYLDEYWKFYPTAGTAAGFTKYNSKLEDFAEANIEKYLGVLDKINADLVNKVAKDKLSPEAQIDFDMLRDALDLDMLRLEKIVPQQYNPIAYNDIILNSLRGLLARESAPIDSRLKDATERAKLIPAFLKQARENLKTPPKEYTDEAVRQFPAILDFYKTEIPKLIGNGGADAKAKFQTEYTKVVAALDDYQKFLQGDLMGKSTGNFRLGEAHQRLLQLTTGGSLILNELGARANADLKNLRNEMFKVCFAYYKIMDPKFDIEKPPANLTGDGLINAVVSHVMDKIKTNHATKEEWLDKIKAAAQSVKAFIGSAKLMDVPDQDAAIELMSPADRGAILARLVPPLPYDPAGAFSVQINPYGDLLPADQAQSFLEEYNAYQLPIWTIQNVYPGTFVPAAMARKNPSLMRKLYQNQALLRGWPVYAEDMFIYAGYNDYDLRQRLMELKLKLETVMDFQLDINVHEGSYTKEQALKLLMTAGFVTQAEAERKWNSIVLNPTHGAYAYIGFQEILDMEGDYKKVKGDQFNRKDFLQKLVADGAVPLRVLKTKIVQ